MGLMPGFGTLVRILGGVALVGLVSSAGLLYRYQRLLIYPAYVPQGSRQDVATPDQYDIPYVEEKLDTKDGEKIRLYVMLQDGSVERSAGLVPSGSGPEAAKTRPTILLLHANAGNMGHRLPLAKVFYRKFACNVVMLSYRGYGLSTGSPSEAGIRIDAQTALEYIRSHPYLANTAVVAYGQSLGGAVAIDVTQRNPKQIQALILENTFISIPSLIPHVLPPAKYFVFLCRERWVSGEVIKKLPTTLPVQFLSGRKDELVPPYHMDTLFKRCSSNVKFFKAIPSGMHNDTCAKSGYFDEIGAFLKQHVMPIARQGIKSEFVVPKIVESKSSPPPSHKELKRRGGAATSEDENLTDEGDWVKMSSADISGKDAKL